MPPRLHFLGRPPPRMPAHTRPSLLRLRVPGQRHASSGSLPIGTRLKRIAIGLGLGASVGLGYIYVTDTRASVHKWLAVPVIRWLHPDAEDAHAAGTRTLRTLWDLGLHPRERGGFDDGGNLSIEVRTPLGLMRRRRRSLLPAALTRSHRSLVKLSSTLSVPRPASTRMPRSPRRCSRWAPPWSRSAA